MKLNAMAIRAASCLVLIGGSLLSGCSGAAPTPKVVPVSGTVLYNGKPIDGATVSFWAEGSPRAAGGTTNAQGEFQLSMFKVNDGAMPGPNKITVAKAPPNAGSASVTTAPGDPAAMASMMQSQAKKSAEKPPIPVKYSTLTGTPLTETVSESGPNTFVLQLTD